VVIWDGGNNDLPFYKPDVHITLVDALRPADEEHYYPGETNVRMADMILITKVFDMEKAQEQSRRLTKITKPSSPIFFGSSSIFPEAKDPKTGNKLSEEAAAALVRGKRVLVVDDGPTLTHGGMPFGAGFVLAKNLGAAEIIDPRPYACGSLVAVFEKFTHLHAVLPAMGYGDDQIRDLEATIQATPCDTVILGTPSDIAHLMDMGKPTVVARYNLQIIPDHVKEFNATLDSLFDRFELNHAAEKMLCFPEGSV
jgi:predicted GTPase